MQYTLSIAGISSFVDYPVFSDAMNSIKIKPQKIIGSGSRETDLMSQQWAIENKIPFVLGAETMDGEGNTNFKRNIWSVKNSQASVAFFDLESKGTFQFINAAISHKHWIKIIYVKEPFKPIKGDINGFQGNFRWLSNFWPCEIETKSGKFTSVESAYQASKFLDCLVVFKSFQNLPASKAKEKSRELWEKLSQNKKDEFLSKRLRFMEYLVRLKFTNSFLSQKLALTGDHYLEETNSWNDGFWGVCDGVGENHLGKIIMKVRENLKK